MSLQIITVDYDNPQHAADLGRALDAYASDPMGLNHPLDDNIRNNLASKLARVPHAFSLLCYVDDELAGFTNCFFGFSTFKLKPLINIHDFAVLPEFRRQGLAMKLLERIEEIARENDCCKLTLEVLQGNTVAQSAYQKFGFESYELDPAQGQALFWEKPRS